MLVPSFLKNGDKIALISTARFITPEEIKSFVQLVEQEGFKIVYGKNLFKRYNQFAGTDYERAYDLQTMLDSNEIKAIWIARGGYGTVRILDLINFEKFKKNAKWIIGYSDISVLHLYIQKKYKIPTIHGIMPINISPQKSDSIQSCLNILNIIKGKIEDIEIKNPFFSHLNIEGEAKAKLIGGNLSILYSLTGTDILPDFNNSILFIEDVDEYLYHIDRIMMNLKKAKILSKIKGLIVGAMTDMKDNTIPYGKNAEEIIYEHIKDYEIPAFFGFPGGHIDNNTPLILGKQCKLTVEKDKLKINYLSPSFRDKI